MKKISRRSFLTAMAAVSAAGDLTACGASSATASSVASSVAASSEAATSSEAAPESVTIKAFNDWFIRRNNGGKRPLFNFSGFFIVVSFC